jgi:NAD(P)H-hydrate repair Nnr-like enzyme with NAD(P)H-hydrate dehydratase domain
MPAGVAGRRASKNCRCMSVCQEKRQHGMRVHVGGREQPAGAMAQSAFACMRMSKAFDWE